MIHGRDTEPRTETPRDRTRRAPTRVGNARWLARRYAWVTRPQRRKLDHSERGPSQTRAPCPIPRSRPTTTLSSRNNSSRPLCSAEGARQGRADALDHSRRRPIATQSAREPASTASAVRQGNGRPLESGRTQCRSIPAANHKSQLRRPGSWRVPIWRPTMRSEGHRRSARTRTADQQRRPDSGRSAVIRAREHPRTDAGLGPVGSFGDDGADSAKWISATWRLAKR